MVVIVPILGEIYRVSTKPRSEAEIATARKQTFRQLARRLPQIECYFERQFEHRRAMRLARPTVFERPQFGITFTTVAGTHMADAKRVD